MGKGARIVSVAGVVGHAAVPRAAGRAADGVALRRVADNGVTCRVAGRGVLGCATAGAASSVADIGATGPDRLW